MDQLLKAWKSFLEAFECFRIDLQFGPYLDILEIGKQDLEEISIR